MKNKKIMIFIIGLGVLFLLIGIFIFINDDEEIMTTENIDIVIDTSDSDKEIDWSIYEEFDITLSESFTIDKGGIYNLSGTIVDGFIKINTKDNVNLILKDVEITNSKGPAIYVENAKNVLITLEDGTTNTLIDGSTYDVSDEEINGVIYSKDDLIFDGNGQLVIKSNYQDGIVGKDDIKIISGNYIIESVDDGIRGKDSVYILDGTFDIKALGDGIKSTNDTDTSKGFILIENGSFNIDASNDGIQATTKILIKNGIFNIKTGGGSTNNSYTSNWNSNSSKTSSSAKGIKACDNLVIENGIFSLDTLDDAIHSNNYFGIKDGELEISSSDDGIHADTEIIIDGGLINISKSYEGIESAKMTINGGDIKVVSSDDGINVAGGNDGSANNGRPGQNNFNSSSKNILTINGGTIYVNSLGDGIDVNGSGYINGGFIVVDGPSDNGNGVLDYDGEFVVNGGTLLAGGSSGMAQGISSNSNQYGVLIGFNKTISNGTKISILDSDNNEIVSYSSEKNFSSLVVSTDKFTKSSVYVIKIDDEEYTSFTISKISNTVGNVFSNMGNMDGRGPGRR